MEKTAYERTRIIRRATQKMLARETGAPLTVLAWIRHVDELERLHNSCAWPMDVRDEDLQRYLASCMWDLELWAASQILDLFE